MLEQWSTLLSCMTFHIIIIIIIIASTFRNSSFSDFSLSLSPPFNSSLTSALFSMMQRLPKQIATSHCSKGKHPFDVIFQKSHPPVPLVHRRSSFRLVANRSPCNSISLFTPMCDKVTQSCSMIITWDHITLDNERKLRELNSCVCVPMINI